jgi:hypothetical protein
MTQPASTSLYLPGPDAAVRLGVTVRTLQRMAQRGQIERRTLGGRVLYAVQVTRHEATPDVVPVVAAVPVATGPHSASAAVASVATLDLGAALVALTDRTVRAELDAAAARAELATVRAELATMTRQAVQAHIRWQAARAGRDAALAQLEALRRA